MKKLITLVLLSLPMFCLSQNYNPFLAQGIIAPAPLNPVEANGIGTASFIVGNSGSSAMPLVANQEMLLVITLSRGLPNVTDPNNVAQVIASISGSFAGYFNWQYDPSIRTFLGTQNQTLPGFSLNPSDPVSAGYVIIPYKVTQNSPRDLPQNGFNVNITPPAYANGSNALGDDNVSSYTWTNVLITGNVFDDANGNTLIDGTESGTTAGTTLYVYLVNTATGVVENSGQVQPDGTYTLAANQNTNYTIEISTVQYPILTTNVNTTPIDNTLPINWIHTGENGAGNIGLGDGNPDGNITFSTTSFNLSQQNFGIEQLPNSITYTTSIPQPFVGQLITLNGGTNPTAPSGTDPEDGTLGAGATIVITSLPTNATLLYGGVAVTLGQVIPNFNPSLLQIEITSATVGSTSTSFGFAYVDAAGEQDPTPAIYTVNWGSPLPVSMTSFTAQAEQNCIGIRLRWTTASEQNNRQFVIERSVNGLIWLPIATVAGAGNSTTEIHYTYLDTDTNKPGIYQYRLRQQDMDGREVISKIATAESKCESRPYYVYPNPVNDILNIKVPGGENRQVRIINAIGQVMKDFRIRGNATEVINVANWAPGMYDIIIIESGKKVFGQKVVKIN
jgi:hypothetical protein